MKYEGKRKSKMSDEHTMNTDNKDKEEEYDIPEEKVFWYEFSVEKKIAGSYGRERFKLHIRLRPEDMYAIIRGIVECSIHEDWAKELRIK